MRAGLLAALWMLLVCAQTMAQTPRAKVDLRCDAVAIGPTLDCLVQLATREGQPLNGAQVQLGATMPSMPMAHRVKPAVAAATGKPGEYRGTLELEMSGVWALQVDINGPLRDRAIVRLQADECPDGHKRCAVRAAKH
jgi:YtkA-like